MCSFSLDVVQQKQGDITLATTQKIGTCKKNEVTLHVHFFFYIQER